MHADCQTKGGFDGKALFSRGFRPFFILSALYAALIIPAWLLALAYGWAIGPPGNTLAWHAHEMLFGYIAGIFAGFLLTALPSWTGRPALSGPPLVALVLLWLAGRLAWLIGAKGFWIMLVDEAFLGIMAAIALGEVTAARKWSALPVCLLAIPFMLSHVLVDRSVDLGVDARLAERLALAIMTMLMGLIGGRIIPSFTRNWLGARGDPAQVAEFGAIDSAAMVLLALAVSSWTWRPTGQPTSLLAMIAAASLGLRIVRWKGLRTRPEPLLAMLHIAYSWLPLSCIVIFLSASWPDLLAPSLALHALAAGAAGSLTIAVMTRASLGHTGRPLVTNKATLIVYGLVLAGGMARILLPSMPLPYSLAITIAGSLWAAGFLVFVLAYGPILLQPRVTSDD